MSKTRILIHIVFTTKYREQTIPQQFKRGLYAYMHGIIKNFKSKTLRINGTFDHVHIFLDLHPSFSVASLVKELKRSSSLWTKGKKEFKFFRGWNDGYYAASVGPSEENTTIEYIRNQENHHGVKSLDEEFHEMALLYHLDLDKEDI